MAESIFFHPKGIHILARQDSPDDPMDLVFRRFVVVPGEQRLQEEVADPLVFRPIRPDEVIAQPTVQIEREKLRWIADLF